MTIDLPTLIVIIAAISIFLILGFVRGTRLRKFIIGTAERVILIVVVLLTYLSGKFFENLFAASGGASTTGFIIGLLIGFIVSACFTAIFFLLVQIENNTRKDGFNL